MRREAKDALRRPAAGAYEQEPAPEEGVTLIKAFEAIENPADRRKVIELAQSLAKGSTPPKPAFTVLPGGKSDKEPA
jgi:hypothetical protein